MKKRIVSMGTALAVAAFLLCGASFFAPEAFAWTAKEIDAGADASLDRFTFDVRGSKELLKKAKGVLVFPWVFKAGIGIGGEYGEGALRIKDKTVDYYSTAAASIGFQLGGQKKTIILVFLDQDTLDRFRAGSGWKIGADASVAVLVVGVGGAVDTNTIKDPVVAFIFDQKGLMYNLTLEGAKITRIKRD